MTMGDKFVLGYDMERYIEQDIESLMHHVPSKRLQNAARRYDISDEEIREFVFAMSNKDLCLLTDKLIMDERCLEASESELDKVISIAAHGIGKLYLTPKQQWCLASFCMNYMRDKKETTEELEIVYKCPKCNANYGVPETEEFGLTEVEDGEFEYLCPKDRYPLKWGMTSNGKM
jgi:hypothetical protein